MKITRILVRKENLLLTRPYTIAFKTISSVENGIIEIITNTGLSGLGSFNPSYEVIGERLEDAMQVLSPENLEWLIGTDVNDVYEVCRKVQQKFSGSITARTGIEIALFDLYAQSVKIPLVGLLGQKITSMPTSITIGIKNAQETIIEAKEYIERKFKILKIKLGICPEEDLERLIKLREVFGNSIRIMIDANQGYNEPQLIRFHNLTKSLDIVLIEEPLKTGNENVMRNLPQHIKDLIAADESLITPDDALALAATPKACGYFNIKLMKCGGITEALKIAEIGADNNIELMWGCNDESLISITAALHTAFACSNTKYIDLDGSLDLQKDAAFGGFILKDGIMYISEKPGLGLNLISH